MEQVQNHNKLITGALNKLLKADDIKLSWEETACAALVLEELLPKAGHNPISMSKSQIEVGDKLLECGLWPTVTGLLNCVSVSTPVT